MSRFPLLPAAVVSAAALLAACGGGVYFGYDGRDLDDRPPTVSLAASLSSGQPGQVITLVAAASDDRGIDNVTFYRVDGSVSTPLGTDGAAPYQRDTALPNTASGSVQYFARATDGRGQQADSALISVGVLP